MVSKLKQARQEAGLKQFQLAQLVGVSENKISQWETRRMAPTHAQKIRLSDVLRCKVEDLF